MSAGNQDKLAAQAVGNTCDWQIRRQKVSERGKFLLETAQWSDCQFVVGTEPHQQLFSVHKLFLAMSSPVFEAMFFGGMPEKDEPIPILDVQPEAFKALLEYIYTDEINLQSFDQACELCYVAKKYMIPHVVEECTKYLWGDLFPKNACRAYEFARLFEEPVLMEKCLRIICSETEAVLREGSFEDIEVSTLETILDQEELSINSELELFEAVQRWAAAECSRRGVDIKSMRNVLGSAIGKIRFLTLTPAEFAEGPALSPLLTKDESFAILMNISSKTATKVPLPESFSMCSVPRKRPAGEDKHIIQLPGEAREGQKYYCLRNIVPQPHGYNTSNLDCSVSFTVDRNICVLGVQVPTQICPPPPPFRFDGPQLHESYTEVIYAHLLDSDGSRLTYTHVTSRVSYASLVEITFDRPVYIQRNKIYRVGVVLNKIGRYPMGTGDKRIVCGSVLFNFCVGPDIDSVREGVIRSIVFTY